MGYESDQNCVAEALLCLAKSVFRQLLNKDTNLTGSGEALRAETVLVEALKGTAARKRAGVLAVSKKLAAVQVFPKHILNLSSMYNKVIGLFKNPVIFRFLNRVRRGVGLDV